ncbi:MAG: hypothetical protein IID48_16090 [Proteobacteria bacterium]|nr:hypothetical protein [Pseudomonadota bacterium]
MAALGRFRCRAAIGDTHGKRAAQGSSLRGFLEFWLPKSIYRHRSPLIDIAVLVPFNANAPPGSRLVVSSCSWPGS